MSISQKKDCTSTIPCIFPSFFPRHPRRHPPHSLCLYTVGRSLASPETDWTLTPDHLHTAEHIKTKTYYCYFKLADSWFWPSAAGHPISLHLVLLSSDLVPEGPRWSKDGLVAIIPECSGKRQAQLSYRHSWALSQRPEIMPEITFLNKVRGKMMNGLWDLWDL